ncbi:hypothetical protein GOP47_0028471 [Adiantum capillus-veneris]|nr:hypothetical protein GOP47_0028471 [Adiantum capillus-veneris]
MEVPYRCWARVAAKLADRQDYTISAPVLLIMGDKDYVYRMSGIREAVEAQQSLLPKVKVVHIEEGSHFVQEQFPKQVLSLLHKMKHS